MLSLRDFEVEARLAQSVELDTLNLGAYFSYFVSKMTIFCLSH